MTTTAAAAGEAAREWRAYWPLVLAAAGGMALSTMTSYSTHVFLEPVTAEFGWTRTQFSSGSIIAGLMGVATSPFVGAMIDRHGPRRMALAAVVLVTVGTMIFSTARADVWHWRLLWVIFSAFLVFIQPTIWTAAVAGRFVASRGLALAVALSGGGIGSIVTPPLTAWLIGAIGWRATFVALPLCWAAVVLPLLVFLFHPAPVARDPRRGAAAVPGGRWRLLRSGRYLRLALAALCVASVVVTFSTMAVPVLSARGLTLIEAAATASWLGIGAIGGRLATGWFLDRFDPRRVGAVCVLLPALAVALLLTDGGDPRQRVAAILVFGVSLGAELDIMAYLVARYFPLAQFGVLFGTISGIVILAANTGPLLLNLVYDRAGSYSPGLLGAVPLCLAAAGLLLTLGPPPLRERTPTP